MSAEVRHIAPHCVMSRRRLDGRNNRSRLDSNSFFEREKGRVGVWLDKTVGTRFEIRDHESWYRETLSFRIGVTFR